MHRRRLERTGSLDLLPRQKLADQEVTAELVRRLFDYDPETGHLTHKPGKTHWRPGVVGSLNEFGYLRLGIASQLYYAQRVVWLHFYGQWPKWQVDHINDNRSDNRIANLRDVDRATNGLNRHRSAASSGIVGAQATNNGRFQCYVKYKGTRLYLGKFDTPEEAGAARSAALKDL